MVRELKQTEIDEFIDFGDRINKNDPNYVPFMRGDLKKTLKKLVFEKKKYKALISLDDDGKIQGRILLTVNKNKQLKTDHCGYFSHFEVINDQKVFDELFAFSEKLLITMGAEYLLGSFFFHDPDNRRGILISGFELFPMIFTSHNLPYYHELFEKGGFEKLTDAFEYEYQGNDEIITKIKDIAEKSLIENDLIISKINFSDIDRDIEDVHTIMSIASTEINFETVLSKEEIRKIFNSWKSFIDPDYAFIARKKSDASPIGFTLSIPNYFEIIKKMNGRMNLKGLWVYLTQKKKVKGIRGILQYIIPEYQHKGVSKALYYETKKSVDLNQIERVSLGTIMEKNNSSNGAIVSIGGELSRVYRIYYKKITH